MHITYRKAAKNDLPVITHLLFSLYDGEGQAPGISQEELLAENEQLLADERHVFFLALDGDKPVGIAHSSLRHEYVNGTDDGTKGYLEAIYVLPNYRKNGIAATLNKTAENWAAEHGCQEMASDCLIDNIGSYKFHLKIGYAETERCIFFAKSLVSQDD